MQEWSHSTQCSVTIIQIQPNMNKRYILDRKMPSTNKENCFWKIPNVSKPLTFLPKDAILLHGIYSNRKIILTIFVVTGLQPIWITYSLAEWNLGYFSQCPSTTQCVWRLYTALGDTDLRVTKKEKEEAFMSASFKPYCGNRNQVLSLLQPWHSPTRKKEIHYQRIFPHWRNLHSPS